MSNFKNNIIAYTVDRASVSGLYILVANGQVVVRAPWYLSTQKIQQYVEEKTKWIVEKLREHEDKKIEKRNYIQNKTVKILGKNFALKIIYKNIKLPKLEVIEGFVRIEIPIKYKKMDCTDIIQILLEKMYDRLASEEIENIMEKVRLSTGIAPEDYEIKRMENVIAKFLPESKIIINPDIVRHNKTLIEYIITHEFCHIKYRTHSKKFYQLLKEYVPNYMQYEKELTKNLINY